MTCPVTEYVFSKSEGKHEPCPTCQHCQQCDHYPDKDAQHAHYRDSQQMKGLRSRMFPNSNRFAYCHVTLCVCVGRYDFNFGYNIRQDDVPTYEQPTVAKDDGPGGTTEEDNTVIPRGQPQQDQGGNNRGKRKGSGLRYLSADMLSATHQAATINDARVENDTFRQGTVVTVKLKFKGEFILWTLRPGNPNLETLGDALGDDETTWHGHDIELYVEEDNFNGKKWIRSEVVVSSPHPTSAPAPKGRR
jgi:hypothetical protein